MLKVVISENGCNLCIESGDSDTDVCLTVYADDAVESDGSIVVSRSELNRAIAFVMKDDLPKPEPTDPEVQPTDPVEPPTTGSPCECSHDCQP